MKRILLALSFVGLAVSSSCAEKVVLTFQYKESEQPNVIVDYKDITLAEGQFIQLSWLAGTPGKMKALLGDYASGSFPALDTPARAADYLSEVGTKGYSVGQAKGPCKVRITPLYNVRYSYFANNTGNWDYLPYRIEQQEGICEYEITTTTSANSSIQSISNTAVVVPSNAVGDVDVLLEQSTDMITWTQCLPGTYNASTVKRFFRVRAVEK
jgi:hypothetical protein